MADLLYWTVVVSVPAYLVLQLMAFVYLDGSLRAISVGLAVFMTVVGALTLKAYMDRSNVWPLYIMYAGPPGTLLTAILLAIGALRRTRDSAGHQLR